MTLPINDSPEPDEPYKATEVSLPDGGDAPGFAWNALLSWVVILTVCIGLFGLVGFSQFMEKPNPNTSPSEMMAVNSQAKMMVGQMEFSGNPPAVQLDTMNQGALEQRYGIVLLKSELESPKAAEKLLREIDELVEEKEYEPSAAQKRLRKIIGTLLEHYQREQWDSSVVPNEEREFLVSHMGWVGRLALTPEGSPNETGREQLLNQAMTSMYVSVGLCVFVAMGLAIGMGTLVTVIVLLARRRLTSHFFNGDRKSVIYLETFAIWMFLFAAAQFSVAAIRSQIKMETPWVGTALTLSIFFGSLLVLTWPVIRGLSFSQVRRDIGWTARNPLKELGAGVMAYFALVPFIAVALAALAILMAIMAQAQGDSLASKGMGGHPIQDQIASGEFSVWIGVFLTACVAAPIVEETMFRGVFYRHLKDSSSHRPLWSSVLFACLINGLVFAAIHPQGLVGIPFLTLLAVGMSLARQWRDSLIASMTMHAINNGLITCLMFAIF